MESSACEPEDRRLYLNGPVRILVQTKTHLPPGDEYIDRCIFMLNLICQHHWDRDFEHPQDRWHVHGAQFGYDNRDCYFLVDHGPSPSDEDVPILWYEWKGESLIKVQRPLPRRIRAKIAEFPFTKPPRQIGLKRPPLDAENHRQLIKSKLHSKMSLSAKDIDFVKEHPKHATWLKDHLEQRFWLELVSIINKEEEHI